MAGDDVAFQAPRTVEGMLKDIHERKYLMPAIQREFVWGPEQIIRLFDSLMRGYPVGSFLLWEVSPRTAESYTFYEFLTHYHERDSPYATKATLTTGSGTTAVLDGQQRLTSLNIGLYGSLADKKKYAWWNSADAFPKKRLYLNLETDPPDEELGLRYNLKFLTEEDAAPKPGASREWFQVGRVLTLADSGPAIMRELADYGIEDHTGAFERLYNLYQAVRVLSPMNYFLVTDQDPDKVLEIFVRVNSGGTQLSYSDLLLSMATNQWQDLDAREEVRSLVAEINTNGGRQFAFSKDLVLKSALMIAGLDVRFQVSNFTSSNMRAVEEAWPDIRASLLRAATLLQQFGYNERNLTANSVLIPVAYYLHRRAAGDTYLDSTSDAGDRLRLQHWVTRSLIKRGVWGSGLDSTLMKIRDVLLSNDRAEFPVAEVEKAMASVGRGLTFDDSEIDELLNLKYGAQRTFPVLSVLYAGLDLSKRFHEDHVFPKSRFTRKKLEAAGVPHDRVQDYLESVNLLPNLQLLAGTANIEKQAQLPDAWIASAFPSEDRRRVYCAENDLDSVELGLDTFLDFISLRRSRMRQRLTDALAVGPRSTDEIAD
jgi:hypothetical protein